MSSMDNHDEFQGNIPSEDEDRKFLRAAAEAIVATSMNSQIDPTILELLKRIQYASNDQSRNHRSQQQQQNQHQQQNGQQVHTPQQQNNGNGINSNGGISLNNNNHNDLTTSDHLMSGFNAHDELFNQTSLVNPARTSQSHFPTFNLSYFDNLASASISSTTSASSTNTNNVIGEGGSNGWGNPLNNGVILSNQRHNSITTPNSITSTPPGTHTPPSASNLLHRTQSSSSQILNNNGSEKPFVCKDCALSFRRSSDLRRHQRAHLPILPHICQLCGKGFARKDALKRHSDTLTCKRNREKLLSSGGDLDSILAQTHSGKNS